MNKALIDRIFLEQNLLVVQCNSNLIMITRNV